MEKVGNFAAVDNGENLTRWKNIKNWLVKNINVPYRKIS